MKVGQVLAPLAAAALLLVAVDAPAMVYAVVFAMSVTVISYAALLPGLYQASPCPLVGTAPRLGTCEQATLRWDGSTSPPGAMAKADCCSIPRVT